MTVSLDELNRATEPEAAGQFRACCGASRWVELMVARRPFASLEALLAAADQEWASTGPADWDEAFGHHPRIGERRAMAAVSPAARDWSAGEQRAAESADDEVRLALGRANAAYERRFGRTCIVCATGRTADQILADIRTRLANDPGQELAVAVEEQRKITALRLKRLLGLAGVAERPS
jgi:OHCU decarboxylase